MAYATMHTSAMARPVRLPYQTARRSRSDMLRLPEHVAGPAQGVDQARSATFFQLLAELADVHLKDVGVPAEVVAPDALHQEVSRQDPTRVLHELAQQVVLGRGQLDRPVASMGHPGPGVQDEIPESMDRGPVGLLAPEERPDPRDQHLEGERLDDVVIGAMLQP